MKLELKHLAPYLPYGLKILNGWGDIKTLNYTHLDDEGNGFINHVKPFLRPLSDLTREITHDGETFVPIDKLGLEGCIIGWNGLSITLGQEEGYSFTYAIDVYNNIVQKLLAWHFDVFGLIPAGLALDINQTNPDQGH